MKSVFFLFLFNLGLVQFSQAQQSLCTDYDKCKLGNAGGTVLNSSFQGAVLNSETEYFYKDFTFSASSSAALLRGFTGRVELLNGAHDFGDLRLSVLKNGTELVVENRVSPQGIANLTVQGTTMNGHFERIHYLPTTDTGSSSFEPGQYILRVSFKPLSNPFQPCPPAVDSVSFKLLFNTFNLPVCLNRITEFHDTSSVGIASVKANSKRLASDLQSQQCAQTNGQFNTDGCGTETAFQYIPQSNPYGLTEALSGGVELNADGTMMYRRPVAQAAAALGWTQTSGDSVIDSRRTGSFVYQMVPDVTYRVHLHERHTLLRGDNSTTQVVIRNDGTFGTTVNGVNKCEVRVTPASRINWLRSHIAGPIPADGESESDPIPRNSCISPTGNFLFKLDGPRLGVDALRVERQAASGSDEFNNVGPCLGNIETNSTTTPGITPNPPNTALCSPGMVGFLVPGVQQVRLRPIFKDKQGNEINIPGIPQTIRWYKGCSN